MGRVTPHVRLLAHTPNPDNTVAMGARLCYSDDDIDALAKKASRRDQSAYIEKLMSFGHLSPIEHASFTFGIEGVSRSLLAQITRHRIASFSVKSQRYVGSLREDGTTFSYILPPEIEALGEDAVQEYDSQMETIQGWYNDWTRKLMQAGRQDRSSFEDARFVLPNAAETKMIVTMNARELLHFFELRCCNRAQWEIREVAWQMLEQVMQVAPAIFAKAGPACVSGACSEGKMTCGKIQEVREKHALLLKEHEQE